MLRSLADFEFFDQEEKLGDGAYSQVVKARSRLDGKFYALKQIDVFKVSKLDCTNLRTEIKFHQTFEHKNIIKFYDCL